MGSPSKKVLRAIDLYSGVGGWTLGLKMAGIDVVASYEWWDQANQTHRMNFSTPLYQLDIRSLALESLPSNIDVVVGSPPCTQFSFANRGGNGDIADGLKDIQKFLEIVEFLRPTFWAMENVPRVAGILERELSRGKLRRFGYLVDDIVVVDMAEFGLPQRRRRMIAGSFGAQLLESYRSGTTPATLGHVISQLQSSRPVDPIYGGSLDRSKLTGTELEPPLDAEEIRMNREAKKFHPVYNVMNFPDRLDRSARTVTALCTRVSRESIVIKDGRKYRRLNLRERASLQGFPITFQFFGKSYPSNLKLVGNAVPPLLVYYVGLAIRGVAPDRVQAPPAIPMGHALPKELPTVNQPKVSRGGYPSNRSFRAAIPHLRFGSGTRFELVNMIGRDRVSWRVDFYHGTSKNFARVDLDRKVLASILKLPTVRPLEARLGTLRTGLHTYLDRVSAHKLQDVWSRRGSGTHPFEVVDRLGETAERVHGLLSRTSGTEIQSFVLQAVLDTAKPSARAEEKLSRYAEWIVAGFVVGAWANSAFEERETAEAPLSLAV